MAATATIGSGVNAAERTRSLGGGLSSERTKIGVLGGGAWGTSLALHAARMGHDVSAVGLGWAFLMRAGCGSLLLACASWRHDMSAGGLCGSVCVGGDCGSSLVCGAGLGVVFCRLNSLADGGGASRIRHLRQPPGASHSHTRPDPATMLLQVLIWALEPEVVRQINEEHENKTYFPVSTPPS